jgi:Ca2+-transporting ATPase
MHEQGLDAAKESPGLTSSEARKRLAEYGPNELHETLPVSPLRILARQFTGLLVVILIAAAVIALALGEVIDAAAISLVVLLNGILGFAQEWQAETALEALRSMLASNARVLRDGRETVIDTREIVPGDRVILSAGDKVPADMTLAASIELRMDESALTGESFPVAKKAGDPEARLFMGTSVAAGHGEGDVTATGEETEFGRIAELTGSVVEKTTNLQRVLARLARQLAVAAVGIAAAVAAAGLYVGYELNAMFLTGLSLAVAIVPEGLPAVVTITLALGAAAMVRRQALARRLQAVETLGAAGVICTDKTGTLTEDKMTATRVWTLGRSYDVTGGGYDPAGHIECEGQRMRASDDPDLGDLLETALVCNHAALHRDEEGWQMVGSPTEGALVTLAYKGWAPLPAPGVALTELPFSSERKRMSVLAPGKGEWVLHVKGAPEKILELSSHARESGAPRPLDAALRERLHAAYEEIATEGQRVIALARRTQPHMDPPADEEGLEFLGFVGLMDPPRPEVRAAVKAASGAGIRVIMITGDGAATAKAVARRIGLRIDRVLTGADVEELSDAELSEAIARDVLFARTAPAHKMRIVEALQKQGQIVAMTGDGVNDAPALRKADIGIAMGQRGTDVSRDAADLVLLDDNFSTIVRAIGEGRRQFDNVRKFVRYLLSSNAGEVIALLVNILIGGPLIFLATQILWMNLITDGVTAVALGLEKASPGIMKRPPRRMNENVVGRAGLLTILVFGTYTAASSLWVFYLFLPQGVDVARTAAFTAMVLFEKASVFAFRSLHYSCSRIGWFSNRLLIAALLSMVGAQLAAVYWEPLQTLLKTAPLAWEHWQLILLLILPLVAVPEMAKMIWSGVRRTA